MNPDLRPPSFPSLRIIVLTIAGLCLNVYLLILAWGDGAVAGCGGGSCDELLASRWSSLLGLPISAFGTLVYALLLVSLFQRTAVLRLPLLGGIAGAALWLIFVQAVILRKFCPWCAVTHVIGLAIVSCAIRVSKPGAFRTVSGWAGLAITGLALMQAYGPAKSGHRIEGGPTSLSVPADGATVSFDEGRLVYPIKEHPRIGPAEAERVLVEYFDYQCPACQRMATYLEALVSAHPGRIAVLLMPVPLDEGCNPHLGASQAHPGSCGIARLSLAVWQRRPESFPAFHKQLIADPSEPTARRLALGLMTEQELDSALTDPWIAQSIGSNVERWRSFSKSTAKLPKLLVRDRRILHGLPSDEPDFLRVMKQELGL